MIEGPRRESDPLNAEAGNFGYSVRSVGPDASSLPAALGDDVGQTWPEAARSGNGLTPVRKG